MDEYMAVSLLSTGYPALITTSFVGMGDTATQDSFDWLATYPRAVKGAAVVCRLMDDVVSRKFEQRRGHVCSAVECCVKEYGGTEEEAIIEFHRQLSDAWKDINESYVPPPYHYCCLPYATANWNSESCMCHGCCIQA